MINKIEKLVQTEILPQLEKGEKVAIINHCNRNGHYAIQWQGTSYCRTSGGGRNMEASALATFLCNLFPVTNASHFPLYHHLDSGRKDISSFGFKLEFIAGLKDGTNVYQLSKI